MSLEGEIFAQFVTSAEIERHLDEFAEQIADEVRERTPVFGDHPPKRAEPVHGAPGDLKASIQVHPVKSPGHRRVQSDDYKVYWAELGAKHFPEVGMFAQVAALHGGTGPVIEEGVREAQKRYRHEAEKLVKVIAEGDAAAIAVQRTALARATGARSAAFRAARGGRRGAGGRGHRR
jgi:hypothetical protein